MIGMSEESMNLVTFEDLKRWSGYKGKAKIIKWLQNNGIAHTIGRSGAPMTTQTAIDKRLSGGTKHESEGEKLEFV
jgi:hypothetical protein